MLPTLAMSLSFTSQERHEWCQSSDAQVNVNTEAPNRALKDRSFDISPCCDAYLVHNLVGSVRSQLRPVGKAPGGWQCSQIPFSETIQISILMQAPAPCGPRQNVAEVFFVPNFFLRHAHKLSKHAIATSSHPAPLCRGSVAQSHCTRHQYELRSYFGLWQ